MSCPRPHQRRRAALLALITCGVAACAASPEEQKLPDAQPPPRPKVIPEPASEKPALGAFNATRIESPVATADARGFGDQAGGGIFIDSSAVAVRLRLDGSRGPLEVHPATPDFPTSVRALFPLGAHTALAETDKGLFTVSEGWLIPPPWKSVFSSGKPAGTAVGADGTIWLAHSNGLYRLKAGELSELKVDGVATHVSHLATGPATGGVAAVWMAFEEKLYAAVQVSADDVSLVPAELPEARMKDVKALAGLSASATAPGELFVLTSTELLRYARESWTRVELPALPDQLFAAGRALWARSSSGLWRFDADAAKWETVLGLDPGARLLSGDPSGAAWVLSGSKTVAVSKGRTPRLLGLDEEAQLFDDQLPVRAVIPPGEKPVKVVYALDARAEIEITGAELNLGGYDAAGAPKPLSLSGIPAGIHTLTVTARFLNDPEAKRAVAFRIGVGARAGSSWEKDMKPLFAARCAKCHTNGPGRDLTSFAAWKENANRIVVQVSGGTMPADGTLLGGEQISQIKRWVQSGMLP